MQHKSGDETVAATSAILGKRGDGCGEGLLAVPRLGYMPQWKADRRASTTQVRDSHRVRMRRSDGVENDGTKGIVAVVSSGGHLPKRTLPVHRPARRSCGKVTMRRVRTPFLYTPSIPPTMRLCIVGGTSTGSTAGWRSTPSVMSRTRVFLDRAPTDPLARPIQGRSLREGKDPSQSGSGFATRFRGTLPTGVS